MLWEAGGLRGGGSLGRGRQPGQLQGGLVFGSEQAIPRDAVRVQVMDARLAMRGPWNLTWTVPGAAPGEEAKALLVVLHPTSVGRREGDIVPRVAEVVLSDRLTSVTLAVDGPSDAALSRTPYRNPAARDTFALTDDRGRDYGSANSLSVSWQPAGKIEPRFDTLTFGPLQPLARRLTLHVPGMAVDLPARAAFGVQVPAGFTMTARDPDRPARASAPWPVDIPLEVNGYQVRFTQAQLEELNGTTLLELLSEPYAPPTGNRWLAGLRLAAVTAPDGRSVGLGTAFSGAGLAGDAGSRHQAALGFDVANPATGEVQPGRYHVELDGVTVAVRGPWGLAWDVSGR